MKKHLLKFSLLALVLGGTASCSSSEKILILTPLEDYRLAYLETKLKASFPELNIVCQYVDTGTLMSRLNSEGASTDCDIAIGIEGANSEILLKNNPSLFQDLSGYDTSKYLPELLNYPSAIAGTPKYHVFDKEAGSIIVNEKVLKQRGLDAPRSFDDLLKPEFKDLVMMPNPKSSGTGFYFLSGLVEAWGEEKALSYFDELSKNVKEYSASGSGPVKALLRDEIAVGLGMTFQAAKLIGENDRSSDIKITYFSEGSPFAIYTNAVINGRFGKKGVKEVYDYIFNTFTFEDKAKFCPDAIYKTEFQPACEIPNYPTGIRYMSMSHIYDPTYKNGVLDKWNH